MAARRRSASDAGLAEACGVASRMNSTAAASQRMSKGAARPELEDAARPEPVERPILHILRYAPVTVGPRLRRLCLLHTIAPAASDLAWPSWGAAPRALRCHGSGRPGHVEGRGVSLSRGGPTRIHKESCVG